MPPARTALNPAVRANAKMLARGEACMLIVLKIFATEGDIYVNGLRCSRPQLVQCVSAPFPPPAQLRSIAIVYDRQRFLPAPAEGMASPPQTTSQATVHWFNSGKSRAGLRPGSECRNAWMSAASLSDRTSAE